MKTLSLRKVSILGLVLMAASAVTAAILPSNKSNASDMAANGSLTASVGHLTCTPTDNINFVSRCNDTPTAGEASGTTGGGAENETSDRTSGVDPQ